MNGNTLTAAQSVLEGHGFSPVPMSLRLTQGDEKPGADRKVEASISCPAAKDGAPDPLWQGKK
jgi:hypothetical protein